MKRTQSRSIHRCGNIKIVHLSVIMDVYIQGKWMKFSWQIYSVLNTGFCNWLCLLKTSKPLGVRTPQKCKYQSWCLVHHHHEGASKRIFNEWNNSFELQKTIFMDILAKPAARETCFAITIHGYFLKANQWKDSG